MIMVSWEKVLNFQKIFASLALVIIVLQKGTGQASETLCWPWPTPSPPSSPSSCSSSSSSSSSPSSGCRSISPCSSSSYSTSCHESWSKTIFNSHTDCSCLEATSTSPRVDPPPTLTPSPVPYSQSSRSCHHLSNIGHSWPCFITVMIVTNFTIGQVLKFWGLSSILLLVRS